MIARGLFTATFASATLWAATGGAVASAELYRTQSYVYGRFEARVRYAAGDGVVSSFFLWKNGSDMAGTFWNELDFEKLGADCYMQTNALFGNPVGGHEERHDMPATMCSAYHDYAFEWTPTYISWSIDGTEIRREEGETATAYMQNASAGMNIRFNIWPGNADFGGNFSPSILPVHQYISWVQYSSYANGSFNFQWREEFNGNGLPNGWAVGNWSSPFNLSTHTSQNVSFVNGFAVLSLTADNATGFRGTPPPDTGTGGGAGAGGATSGGAGGGGSGGSMAGIAGMGGAAGRGGNPSGGLGAGGAIGGAMNAGGMGAGAMNAGGAIAGQSGGSANSGAGGSGAVGGGFGNAGAGGVSTSGSPGFGGATSGGQGAGGAAGSTDAGAANDPVDPDAGSGCGCRSIRSRGGVESSAAVLLLLGLLLSRRRNGVQGR